MYRFRWCVHLIHVYTLNTKISDMQEILDFLDSFTQRQFINSINLTIVYYEVVFLIFSYFG